MMHNHANEVFLAKYWGTSIILLLVLIIAAIVKW